MYKAVVMTRFASCKDKMSSQYLICPGMQALNLVHSILVYGLVFAVMCCLLLIQYTIVHVDAYQMHCDPSQTIHEDLKTLDESWIVVSTISKIFIYKCSFTDHYRISVMNVYEWHECICIFMNVYMYVHFTYIDHK